MKNVKDYEITIEGKEWTNSLDKAFNKKQKDLKVDGFRKGNCPKEVYIKKFGIESLYMDAVDLCINDAYKKVIDDNKIEPVCEPKVDIKNIGEKSVTYNFTVITRPEVKLGKYKKLDVKKDNVIITDEEIDKEINTLKNQYADTVEATDGEVEDGNTAVINFKGIVDGKPLEGGSGENYPLEIGSHTFIPGFEEGLVGMKINEEKELKLKFPAEYVDNLKNKDVTFTVKVIGIKKRILPELNEEFYKDLGYDDVKDEKAFRDAVKKHLLEHKNADADNKFIDELLKKASENLEVEINKEIVDEEVNRMLNQYREQLKMQGLTLEQYLAFSKSDVESLKKMMEPEATSRVKERYLLEEISAKENIMVTDEEVKTEIKRLADNYQVKEDELINMVGGEDVISYDLKMRKAINSLKDNN
jgi:trigger factor